MPGKPVIERVSYGIEKLELFATCLVSAQDSGFMDYVNDIVFNSSIPKFAIPVYPVRFVKLL